MSQASTQFKPGQSGNPGGKPKGTKSKIRFDVAAILKEEGCNPFKILAQIALGNPEYNRGQQLGAMVRKDAASELCAYVAPKLRSIEITGDEALDRLQLIFNIGANADNNVHSEQGSEPVSS